jgi:hypothetical protein
MRFEVLTTMNIKMTVFWNVMLHISVEYVKGIFTVDETLKMEEAGPLKHGYLSQYALQHPRRL